MEVNIFCTFRHGLWPLYYAGVILQCLLLSENTKIDLSFFLLEHKFIAFIISKSLIFS